MHPFDFIFGSLKRYHRNLLHNIGLSKSFFDLTWQLLPSLPRPNSKHTNPLQMINFVLIRPITFEMKYTELT